MTAGLETGATIRTFHNYAVTIVVGEDGDSMRWFAGNGCGGEIGWLKRDAEVRAQYDSLDWRDS
jgi:hypothetical protein